MELKITCPECTCRYAVIGTAYFCPACGHNAANQMFDQSITTIQKSVNTLSLITLVDTAE